MSKCYKVELTFFPAEIEPTEDSKVLFWCCGELYDGCFFMGKFYHRGNIYFPDSWAYVPKEEPKF